LLTNEEDWQLTSANSKQLKEYFVNTSCVNSMLMKENAWSADTPDTWADNVG